MKNEQFRENGKKYDVRLFDDVYDFIDNLKKYEEVEGWYNDSVRAFNLGDTYDEAVKKTFMGDDNADFQSFMLKFKDTKLSEGEVIQKKKLYGVQGFCPSVPRFLSGQPKSMNYRKKIVHKKRIINLFTHLIPHCGVTNYEVVQKAKEILELAKAWEMKGYRVELNYIFTANWVGYRGKTVDFSSIIIPLKRPENLLSLQRFSYVYCGLGFNRGLVLTDTTLRALELGFECKTARGCGHELGDKKEEYLAPILERFGGNNTRVLYIDFRTNLDQFKREIEEEK